MISKKDRETREKRDLCPWATLSANSRGRRWQESSDPFRTGYLRDRDRLLHSTAFRRLQLKTQVLCVSEGDHYRTRMTHTLEVWQMGQSTTLALGLNSDLAQAVALAHDLGHPPFGHTGEETLARLMADQGGFSHNAQAARLVDHLEHRSPAYSGLNLTFETRRSLLKHSPPANFPLADDLQKSPLPPLPLEAQVVDLTDSAAYLHHDLDDALRTGLIKIEELSALGLWDQALAELKSEGRIGPGPGLVTQVLARMIKRVNQDIIFETGKAMDQASPDGPPPRPCHSVEVKELLRQLHSFLSSHFYQHQQVRIAMEQAATVVRDLFIRFCNDPGAMPESFQELITTWGRERAVCDYLAGMTDRYAWTLAGVNPSSFNALP